MRTTGQLVKRNFLIFIRDKGAVFFSLLAMGIVILLMTLFLGNINVEEMTELLARYGGSRDKALDEENARRLIKMWTIAGLLIVNSVMVTMTSIGLMVQDSERHRLESFRVTPVSGFKISLGYILSAVCNAMAVCILTLLFTEGGIVLDGGEIPGVAAHIRLLGLLFLITLSFALMMYLPAVFIKSGSAWSGLGTVIGTLVGFLGGIYLPVGSLPEKVGGALKYLPVLHGASLLREIFTGKALETAFEGLDLRVVEEYKEYMGITVKMKDTAAEPEMQALFLLGCGIIALITAAAVLKYRSGTDRNV